jgi:hypothetical protein
MVNISGVLYQYFQKVLSDIMHPIISVFLLGIFHKHINVKETYVNLGCWGYRGSIQDCFRVSKSLFRHEQFLD